jgi:hypothetical protein
VASHALEPTAERVVWPEMPEKSQWRNGPPVTKKSPGSGKKWPGGSPRQPRFAALAASSVARCCFRRERHLENFDLKVATHLAFWVHDC